MLNPREGYFQEDNSWFDCIGDVDLKTLQKGEYMLDMQKMNDKQQEFKTELAQINQYYREDKAGLNDGILKRSRDKEDIFDFEENKQQSSNSSYGIKNSLSEPSSEEVPNSKKTKQTKSKMYSKKYRQKMKQHVKHLQEQNESLKKKLTQVQFRLREAQLELNRLKFMPQQKQFTNEQLNQEFLDKVKIPFEKNIKSQAQCKTRYQATDPFYNEYLQIYSKHGFGGTNKTELLRYYFNQILEVVMRDSERYLSLLFMRSKDRSNIECLPQYDLINRKFMEILQPDAQKMKRLSYFEINLHPMIIEFTNYCKQLNKSFQLIMNSISKIHQFMKASYLSNMDFSHKRIIQLQPWFEKQKYSKIMRTLRAQWLEQIKTGKIINEQEQKKNQGNRRKKNVHKDQ